MRNGYQECSLNLIVGYLLQWGMLYLEFMAASHWKFSKQRIGNVTSKFELNVVVSHVVGVLKVYYLLSYAGSTLGQHCCMVATANIYKSQ